MLWPYKPMLLGSSVPPGGVSGTYATQVMDPTFQVHQQQQAVWGLSRLRRMTPFATSTFWTGHDEVSPRCHLWLQQALRNNVSCLRLRFLLKVYSLTKTAFTGWSGGASARIISRYEYFSEASPQGPLTNGSCYTQRW